MRFLSLLVALGLVLALTTDVSAAGKTKKKGKKGAAPVAGVVKAIDTDSLSLKVKGNKKASATAAAATDKKLKLTESTKFEKADGAVDKKAIKGKKASSIATKPAERSAVSKKTRVLVFAKDDTAERVVVLGQNKKKKAS